MGIAFGGFPLVDPDQLAEQCWDASSPLSPWRGRANLFTCPAGREWGTGAVLMLRSDLDALDKTREWSLVFEDDAERAELKRLSVVRAAAVVSGFAGLGGSGSSAAGDPSRVYLVELVDRRFFLARIPIDKGYNLLDFSGSYLTPSLNAGTAWTWTQLVQDLWNTVGAAKLGTYPGLPFTPHGTPQGFDYFGGFAWDALNDVLDRLACVLDFDPLLDATGSFSIVRAGSITAAEQGAFDYLKQRRLHWDGDPVDPERGSRPQFIRVRFLRVPEPSGGTSPFHIVNVTLAAAAGVEAGTYVTLDDDLRALGATGTPSNGSACANRAVERADDWLRKHLYRDRRLMRVYRDNTTRTSTAIGATATRTTFDARSRALKVELESGPDLALELWKQARRSAGFSFMDVRITAKTGSGSTAVYTGNVSHETAANVWADVAGPITLTTLIRIPSNVAVPAAGTPSPPDIPTVGTQHMAVTLDPDVSGYYRIIGPAGGQLGGMYEWVGCDDVTGEAVIYRQTLEARDFNGKIEKIALPPPPPSPPPPTTETWYCVDDGGGGRECAFYVNPPTAFYGGPYPDKPTCILACAGAGRAAPTFNALETTIGTDPRTVSTTLTIAGGATGVFVGPMEWRFGVPTNDVASLNVGSSDQQTGNSFSIVYDLIGTGTFDLNIELTDTSNGDVRNIVWSHTVAAVPTTLRNANGNLTGDDAGRFTPCDTTAGNITLTFTVSASGRSFQEWAVGNVVGGNNVQIDAPAGETIEGGASITLLPGERVILRNDNLDAWYIVGDA